jgi:hypothetical protein
MVEVFKTNVAHHLEASWLINQIQIKFTTYHANFDLEDCDKILRVLALDGTVHSQSILDLLLAFGFDAEVLPDDCPLDEGLPWSKQMLTM